MAQSICFNKFPSKFHQKTLIFLATVVLLGGGFPGPKPSFSWGWRLVFCVKFATWFLSLRIFSGATLGESSAIQTVRSSTAHHQALDLFRKLAHDPSSITKGKSTMCRCVVFCLENWGHFCFSYMRLLQNQKNDVVFLFEVMMDKTCSRISLGWLHPYIPENSKSAMVISFSYVILFNQKDWYFEYQICLSFLVS